MRCGNDSVMSSDLCALVTAIFSESAIIALVRASKIIRELLCRYLWRSTRLIRGQVSYVWCARVSCCASYRHSWFNKNLTLAVSQNWKHFTRGPSVTFHQYRAINYAISVIARALKLSVFRIYLVVGSGITSKFSFW